MADVPAVGTDDALLKNIPGIDDDDPAKTDDDPAKETPPGEVAPVPADEVIGKGDDEVKKDPPARGPGDLIDSAGTVLAKGGAERRLYEQAQRVTQERDTLQTKVSELEASAKAVTDAGSVGTQLGLTPEEVTNGAQLISAYKQNPIETIKYLLTQAQASGHNVTDVGTGTDVSAIKRMLDEAMKPFVDERNERLDTQRNKDEAAKVYNAFIGRHPDAVVHQDAIAQLLEKDPTLNTEAAYLKLQLFYLTKKLDWTKSLDTLTKEVGAGQVKKTQTTLPAGGADSAALSDTAEVASVSTSMDDIIRQSMKEAGVTS